METDSLLKLAKAAWLQQDKDKAGQIWRWCYVNRPQDSRAEETMHDLARYDTWRGNHPERKTLMDRLIALGSEMAPRLFYMLGDYDKILLSYPKSSVADNVLFYRGLNAYLQGQVAGSAKYLQQLLDTIPDGDRRGAALYWMAKIHERQGRPQQAESLLKELVKEYPYDYWAYRAAKKLGQPDNGSLAMCPLSKKYERLAQLGCYDDVGLEIQGECRKDDRNLFYVRPFWPTILKTAERYNVDPHLVAAVIREESRYNPVAISRSGAVGLMQLMPRTARIVADQLGLSNFSTGQLIDPQINILLGTKYLQELQCRFFVGDEINAIASYNAGPGAMKRWKKKYGPIVDEDVYIEKIPYPETREYVKKVLRSYWVYKSATADEKTVML
jgi:soluble lytic murein transglycosylase-like protein